MMSKRKQVGIVLLTTIIMISILSLLVLTMLQAMHLYIKAGNASMSHHKLIYGLEDAAFRIIRSELSAASCIVNEKNPNHLNRLLVSGQGCPYINNKQHYSYLIADLGLYPCLQIASNNQNDGSHHWWISVIAEQGDLLQLRIAQRMIGAICESRQQYYIHEGVLSWRYLPKARLSGNSSPSNGYGMSL